MKISRLSFIKQVYFARHGLSICICLFIFFSRAIADLLTFMWAAKFQNLVILSKSSSVNGSANKTKLKINVGLNSVKLNSWAVPFYHVTHDKRSMCCTWFRHNWGPEKLSWQCLGSLSTVSRVPSSSGDIFGRGDFSLGVNMGSNSIPPKTPSDESINRGLVCAYMHFIPRTQKILTFMS